MSLDGLGVNGLGEGDGARELAVASFVDEANLASAGVEPRYTFEAEQVERLAEGSEATRWIAGPTARWLALWKRGDPS